MHAIAILPSILGFFSVPAAFAGAPLAVSVKVPDSAPVGAKDVFVAWTDVCAQKSKSAKSTVSVAEKDAHYVPPALVAQVGDKLLVNNQDKVKHNSFALKSVNFDSGLQLPGTTYSVPLERPGVTKLFCRIHPKMAADVLVLPNSCFLRLEGTAGLAKFELPAPPEGKSAKVWLWSPRLKSFASAVATGGRAEITLKGGDFLPAPSEPSSSEGYQP